MGTSTSRCLSQLPGPPGTTTTVQKASQPPLTPRSDRPPGAGEPSVPSPNPGARPPHRAVSPPAPWQADAPRTPAAPERRVRGSCSGAAAAGSRGAEPGGCGTAAPSQSRRRLAAALTLSSAPEKNAERFQICTGQGQRHGLKPACGSGPPFRSLGPRARARSAAAANSDKPSARSRRQRRRARVPTVPAGGRADLTGPGPRRLIAAAEGESRLSVPQLPKQPAWDQPRRRPREEPLAPEGAKESGRRGTAAVGLGSRTKPERVFNPLQSPSKPLLSSKTQQLKK